MNLHDESSDGAWKPLLSGTLSDVRYQDPVQPDVFVGTEKGRYLQFIAKSYYGVGAGLQYIEIYTGNHAELDILRTTRCFRKGMI